MNKLTIRNYNFDATLLGGQSFSWHKEVAEEDDYNLTRVEGKKEAPSDAISRNIIYKYVGVTQKHAIVLIPYRETLYWQTYPRRDNYNFLKNYLNLDVNYSAILTQIKKDPYVKQALTEYSGIRLLNQNFEQTLISFLASPRKNITSIRNSIQKMTTELGEKIQIENTAYSLFPKTEVIANTPLEKMQKYGFGYRVKSIQNAAKILIQENKFKNIKNLSYEDSKKMLMEFYGVGDKVADCIAVYSLQHHHVMPLDIWGIRILTDLYGLDKKQNYKQMSSWFSERFGENTAWAGQILFEWIRRNYYLDKKALIPSKLNSIN